MKNIFKKILFILKCKQCHSKWKCLQGKMICYKLRDKDEEFKRIK